MKYLIMKEVQSKLKRGGYCPKSGAKKKNETEKKKPKTTYHKGIEIDLAGGKEEFKQKIYKLLKNEI